MRMPPRLMQVLLRRFVENRTRADFASLYGLDVAHGDVLVFKAERAFAAALSEREESLPPAAEDEWVQSQNLAEGLPPHLQVLIDQGAEVQEALHLAEVFEAQSPRRARIEWLRRIAIAAILAIAAFSYWRERNGPKKPNESRPGQTQTIIR